VHTTQSVYKFYYPWYLKIKIECQGLFFMSASPPITGTWYYHIIGKMRPRSHFNGRGRISL